MKNLEDLKKEASKLINLYNAKQFEDVVRKGASLIKKYPNQILFYNATSLSLSALGKNVEALKILKQALNLQATNIHVLNNIGLIKSNLNETLDAREYFVKALEINENFIDALVNLANLNLKENRVTESFKYLIKAKALSNTSQTNEIINSSLGFYYQQVGDFSNAIKCFNKVNESNPDNTVADKAISLIHKYKNKEEPHLKLMEKKLDKIKDEQNLQSLYFALGKAYEDIKDFKKSFKFLKLGNLIADKKFNYSIKKDQDLFFRIKKLFSDKYKQNILESKKKIIFIVGMPRSGTTLVEQIISSHKSVYGAGELSFLDQAIKKRLIKENQFIYKNLTDINYEIIKDIQNEYMQQVNLFNFKENILTDKAPLNFRWIGFIKLVFPNSKIIHCNRDAMDICFSNFKNTFSSNSIAFCYNLRKLGYFFNLYKDLMLFWKEKFKDHIYDIHYEDLINSQEEETRNLLNFCNLEWDENCLNPQKNKKAVATASLAQVRSPIYNSSIKSWKNYSEELKELKEIII